MLEDVHVLNLLRKFISVKHTDQNTHPDALHAHTHISTDPPQSINDNRNAQSVDGADDPALEHAEDKLTQNQIGLLFKSARRELNVSLPAIAEMTRIRLAYLENIEAGKLDSLPSPLYAAGFIRLYARYVHLDGEEILRRIDLDHTHKSTQHILTKTQHLAKPSRLILGISALLVVVCAGLYILVLKDDVTPLESAIIDPMDKIVNSAARDIIDTDAAFTDEGEENDTPEEHDTEASSTDLKSTPNTELSAPEIPPSSPSVEEAAPAPLTQANLSLRADEDCWVSLTQDGTQLFAATLKKGHQFDTSINANTSITAGNAPALDITLDGIILPRLSRHERVIRHVNIFEHKNNAST